MSSSKKTVAILYPYYPSYRSGVFKRLSESEKYNYEFYFSEIDMGVKRASELKNANYLRCVRFNNLYYQLGFLAEVSRLRIDALIVHNHPYFISNWIYSMIAKLMGIKVLFWTHGWLRNDSFWIGLIRDCFYKIPHVILLYGERARSIGKERGYPSEKLHVIFNSLDYSSQKILRHQLDKSCNIFVEGAIYFIYIGRLLDQVKLDLAIYALAEIRSRTGISYMLMLIGDGPSKASLIELAARLGVDLIIKSDLWNEEAVGPLLYGARALIAPGKVGLSAMHSLAYGTPIITHDDMNFQAPEAEAIVPGINGDLFQMDSVSDLAAKIEKWAAKPRHSSERDLCVQIIESNYTPDRQKKEIEFVLERLFANA